MQVNKTLGSIIVMVIHIMTNPIVYHVTAKHTGIISLKVMIDNGILTKL
jgi:hypothetical protein